MSAKLKLMGDRKKIIFTGGGSGGHVLPALTLIKELQADFEIYYIGSHSGIEKKLTTDLDLQFRGISCGKLRRYFSFENFIDIFKIFWGFIQCLFFLSRFSKKNVILFSTGGFVSVPVVLAAYFRGFPILVHEQTTRMGLANKITSKFANKVLLSFEESLKYIDPSNAVLTGYPVRREIFTSEVPKLIFKEKNLENIGRPLLFVTGGGNGSKLLNEKVRSSLGDLCTKYFVIHQVGAPYLDEYLKLENEYYLVSDFIGDNMVALLKKAEVIISRSGAGTVCELMALGKRSIFIPLKIAQKNEQLHNAMEAKGKIGSMVVEEDSFKERTLMDILYEFEARNSDEEKSSMENGLEKILIQIRSI